MEETLFYVFGIALVLSALALSAVGLRIRALSQPAGSFAGVVAYFVGLVGATSTFAVLNAREEQRDARRRARRGGCRGRAAAAEQATPTSSGSDHYHDHRRLRRGAARRSR